MRELTLDKLKEILRMDVQVVRNKNMASIHMEEKEYNKIKDDLSEEPIFNDDEVILKCVIKN